MRVPEKSELPLRAKPQTFVLDEQRLSLFRGAFGSTSGEIPPTVGAFALQGVFEILNSLHVDWKGLLHATQRFRYIHPFTQDQSLSAETSLRDARRRGGMIWLQFVTELSDTKTHQLIAESSSLIMVKEVS